jgi:hypothetical protein
MTLLALLIVGAGTAELARRSAAGRLVVVLALAPIFEAAVVWSAGLRIVALRNLIATSPFVAIAASAALAALPARRVALAGAAIGVGALALGLVGAGARSTPYDTIARRLVAAGWHASQPVAVFGDFLRYRAPLEWYLPHRPILDASRPTGRACRTLYVIHGARVVRLRDAKPAALRHTTILADPGAAPGCVQPIRRGRLAALT